MNSEMTAAGEHVNPDAITGAPASHPGATGIGAAAGAASGAAAGALGGPIGAVVGAVAGGILGGMMGHEIGEWHDPSDEIYWRRQYPGSPFYDESADFDQDVAPALQFGGALAVKARNDVSRSEPDYGRYFESLEAITIRDWENARRKSKYSYAQARAAIHNAYLQKLRHTEDKMLGVAVYKDA